MRQLTAIMFADIMGYTAMMQENEVQANVTREKFRKVLDREIISHNGRIIQYAGDGALCTFNSAVDAVRSAMEIQKQMRENPQVPLRIGIHLGDVTLDEKNIYGDGVNIASRIESFAVPGGVFISAKVYDEIKNQNDIEAISLGTYELKNVKQPMEIYAISNSGLNVPSKEPLKGKGKKISDRRLSPEQTSQRTIIFSLLIMVALLGGGYFLYHNFLPAKNNITDKSIAILPFENLSENKEDEYFTEGMTDEILTELAQIRGLRVLSRTSTIQYKDTKKTMKEIGEELGVSALVEGSVRKVGNQLRVIVQLINAKTDNHIWAKTYDREVKDVFAIQSEIAQQIASELDNKLTEEEKERIEQKPTANLQAYDYYLRGKSYATNFWTGMGFQNVPLAEHMFKSALKLDPQFAHPYAYLIVMYADVYYNHLGPESDTYRAKAKDLLDTMLTRKIDKPVVHIAIGSYDFKIDNDYDAAIAEFTKTMDEDPSIIEAPLLRSEVYRRQGKMQESLQDLKRVLDRNPNEEFHLSALFETYLSMRNSKEALAVCDKLIALTPEKSLYYEYKTFAFVALQGDMKDARSVMDTAQSLFEPGKFTETIYTLEMLEGNYTNYLNLLLTHPDSVDQTENVLRPFALDIAIMYRAQGNMEEAKKYFIKARDVLEARLTTTPNDVRINSVLGIAYAGLGDRQKAIEYGNRGREGFPLSKDIFTGMVPLSDMALIHTFLGDENEAIQILDQLIKLPFGIRARNSTSFLKLSPKWISLRNIPEFKKLVSEN